MTKKSRVELALERQNRRLARDLARATSSLLLLAQYTLPRLAQLEPIPSCRAAAKEARVPFQVLSRFLNGSWRHADLKHRPAIEQWISLRGVPAASLAKAHLSTASDAQFVEALRGAFGQ